MRCMCVLAGLALVGLGHGQLSSAEVKGIEETLYIGNLSLPDLKFARRPHSPALPLEVVNQSIDDPMAAANTLLGLHAVSSRLSLSDHIVFAGGQLAKLSGQAIAAPSSAEPLDLPPALAEPVRRLAIAVALANSLVRQAQSKLKPNELRQVLESLPQWAVEEDVKFDFVRQPRLFQTELLALVAKLDLAAIIHAAGELAKTVERETANLKTAAASLSWTGFTRVTLAGMSTVVAGVGDDVHRERDARLVIDLGGDDRYYGRAGAGPGNAAVLIDLGGNDDYKLPDVGAGCGLVGIGLAYDLGGHDSFRGGSLCFGAGVAGVGGFFKDGGDDTYQSDTMGQGFACFGVGLLVDSRGADLYQIKLLGQGAAKTMGYGQLVDRSGADTYRAGGLIKNAPLFESVHYSNAQGYAAGLREDTGGVAGGIGLITDLAGEDAYIGETYCQAASYWYALGSLYDAGGNDTYSAYHYAQASAMHMCGAYLFDLAGDDGYLDNFGAAHAIGHDYGVGFLLDRAGNDVYAGRDSRPGIGNANGLGIFVDSDGDDRYSGPPGVGNPARNTGSLGVFVDLAGADQYRTGLDEAEAAIREEWGIAYDFETKPPAIAPTDPGLPPPTPGSIALPSEQELERLYKEATLWNVGTAQGEVRKAVHQLIGIGLPAFKWMVETRIATASRLEQRAFVDVAAAVGVDAQKLLASAISGPSDPAAIVAMMICIDGVFTEAGAAVADAIKIPARQRTAARAAGILNAFAAGEVLVKLASSPDRLTALFALLSLGQLGDNRGLVVATQLLESAELPIRKAAIYVLSQDSSGLGIGRTWASDSAEAKARTGLELLAAIGTPDALAVIGGHLTDSRAGIKISCLIALNGRAPSGFHQRVLELRRDQNPQVRAVAVRIDPGR